MACKSLINKHNPRPPHARSGTELAAICYAWSVAGTVLGTVLPWWEYFLGIMLLGAYREFERRTGELTTAHGAKTEMVIAAIKNPATFRYGDLARACPNVSRPTIKRVLGLLRHEGKVECVKPGRDAVWEKRGRETINGINNG